MEKLVICHDADRQSELGKLVKPSGALRWLLSESEKYHVIVREGLKALIIIKQPIWFCTPKCNTQIKFVCINMTRESGRKAYIVAI